MRKWLLIGAFALLAVGIVRLYPAKDASLLPLSRQTEKQGAPDSLGQAPAGSPVLNPPQETSTDQKNSPGDVSQDAPLVGDTLPSFDSPAAASAPAASAKESAAPSLFEISLGMAESEVRKRLGKPAREEPSSLGYQWLIYNQNPARYLQVGIMNGKVVDLYSNAAEVRLGQVGIGTSLTTLSRQYDLQSVVSFTIERANVKITNQKDSRPLVIQNGIPRIFYLDQQNGDKVTGIRLIDTLVLMRGGYYETRWTYQGETPQFDPPPLNIKQQEQVNLAREKQVLDLVNAIRYRYKLPTIEWNEQAAQVARGHSRDMLQHDFFDHVSATTGMDPFARLRKAGLSYSMAGENIAAGYPDSIEAHESWMNSPGHRKNVMEKNFSHLGVGVVADYYTQAFLTPIQ
ncbi:CAP-associated domain-containing protein [Brevibacillus ruminantium]|uniref:CAP-associated domain-containing protein n=1 Tax=Brevibacillus ruminantium TaxID=2950604 RepID=A0ABY4WGT6_9BACL|nr:CAP-associated domain-containing protein [Brevibacillus ruminantium]USG66366.1 CAP-associated domain-containing protein [Brevibacillus ruminantium]